LSAAAGLAVAAADRLAAPAWARARISRDLRRAALLGWRMPFSAALSSARTACRSSVPVMLASGVPPERRARATSVLTAERLARLCCRLRSDARTRLRAERVFAMRRVIIAIGPAEIGA